MNLSTLVTRIKLNLGLTIISTPFENIDSDITTIIRDITVPVFSLYYPQKDKMPVQLNDLEELEKQAEYEKYLLPEFKDRKLLRVEDVCYDSGLLSGLGSYGAIPIMDGAIVNQMILSNASANLMNKYIPKITFHYEHPRILYLYHVYSYTKVILTLAFEHDKSLASIPETASESFYQLALLDVKSNLFPTMKMYSPIQTPVGNIDLKIDAWEQAESDRRELLKEWDETFHLDGQTFYWI